MELDIRSVSFEIDPDCCTCEEFREIRNSVREKIASISKWVESLNPEDFEAHDAMSLVKCDTDLLEITECCIDFMEGED